MHVGGMHARMCVCVHMCMHAHMHVWMGGGACAYDRVPLALKNLCRQPSPSKATGWYWSMARELGTLAFTQETA